MGGDVKSSGGLELKLSLGSALTTIGGLVANNREVLRRSFLRDKLGRFVGERWAVGY